MGPAPGLPDLWQVAMAEQLDPMAGRMPLRHLPQQLRQRRLQRLAALVAVGCWSVHTLWWLTFAAVMGIFDLKKLNRARVGVNFRASELV